MVVTAFLFDPRHGSVRLHALVHVHLLLHDGVGHVVGRAHAHLVLSGRPQVGPRGYRTDLDLFSLGRVDVASRQAARRSLDAARRRRCSSRRVLRWHTQHDNHASVCSR